MTGVRVVASGVTLAVVAWRLGSGPFLEGLRSVDGRALAAGAALVVAGVQLGPAEEPRRWPRWLALALAAAALASTARSTSWWQADRVGVGPAMVVMCPPEDGCLEARLGDVLSTSPSAEPAPRMTAMIAGRVLAVAAATAATLTAALALLAAARRRARVLAAATIVAAVATLLAIAAFEARASAAMLSDLTPLTVPRGHGATVAIAGALIAIAASAWGLRGPIAVIAAAPEVPVLASGPVVLPPIARAADTRAPVARAPVASAPPPCPVCRTPMLWVSRRATWLCTLCRGREGEAS